MTMWARTFPYALVIGLGLLLAGCSGEPAQQLTGVAKAESTSLSSKISYCASGDAELTLEQATACTYVPRNKLPSQGLNKQAQWVRIQVNAPPENLALAAVHVGPHFLKEIRFYEYSNKQWHEDAAGSQYSARDKHAHIGGYTFIANLKQAEANIYYLKILSPGLNNFDIKTEAWPPAVQSSLNQQIGLGIQIGALTLITLFAVVSYALNPNPVMGRMIFAMVNLLMCVLAGSGLLARYVLFDHPWLDHVLFNWFVCLRLALWIWVSQAFLMPYKAPKWYTLSCHSVYAITAGSLVFIALGQETIPRLLMFFTILAAPIIQIFAIVYTPGIRQTFKTAMITGFLAADALIIAAVVVMSSQSEANELSIYISRLIDFINPVVVLVIMAIQNRLTRQELSEASSKFIALNIRSDFEKKMLAERRVLIDMLTHELKNPLTSISLAIGSLKMSLPETSSAELRRLHNISQAIDNMDAIIEKCSLMNTVDQKIQKLKIEELNLGDFLKQIIQQQAASQRFKLLEFRDANITTDKKLLMVAVNNIMENAVKYSVANSGIQVEVFKMDLPGDTPKYEIVVTNKIHEEWAPDPDLIFNRFYRHPLALQVTGSGLGLYLVDETCRLLGGAVRFSRAADSVKFHIEVPA